MVAVSATVLRALHQAAAEASVDPSLLAAIWWQESNFRPLAVGDIGAGVSLGLGQLNLSGAGAEWRNDPSALLDPPTNARASAAYLRRCLDAFLGDIPRGISAYNQGVGGASKELWFRVNGSAYVDPVLGYLATIQREGLEETWDPGIPEGYREYGKTWLDVAATLKGVCDDALATGRTVRDACQTAAKTWGSR